MVDSVRTEKHGSVTIVVLDRRAVRNAVDAQTAHALHKAFLEFDADDNAVTVRDRDTMAQERIPLDRVESYLVERLPGC